MSPAIPHLHGVILAGGSGTRLWPLSTQDRPKQFLAIGSDLSLLTQTVERLKRVMPVEHIWVVCGAQHAEILKAEEQEIPTEQIIVEPAAKNTAPALALAAIHIQKQDPQAMMAVLPADHFILPNDWENFSEDFRLAAEIATRHRTLLTFGIPPDHPATGFGYIESGETFELNGRVYYQVKAFHEKPELAKAQAYLKQGRYYWNSGMFLWQVETFFRELEKSDAKLAQAFLDLSNSIGEPDYGEKLEEAYQKVEGISIDYAVMERSERVMVIPASFAWDDVGSLSALAKILPLDPDNNVKQGEVYFLDAKENIVISQDKPVALVGVENLVVISAPKGILVLPRDEAQKVKDIVGYLKEIGRTDLL